MDTIDAIMSRRSVRKFKPIPVEFYKIGRLVEAALAAPSAGNLHDFRVMVVTDEGKRKRLAQLSMDQLWMANAPVYIVINSSFVKTERFYGVRGKRLYSIQSSAAAVMNVLLAAHAQGLGACWVGAFDEDGVNDLLGMPGYARVQAIIPVGYADEVPVCPPKYHTVDMCHFNRYGDNSGKVFDIRKDFLKEWSPYTEEAIEGIKKAGKASVEGSQKIGDKLAHHAKKLHKKIKKKISKED